MCKYIDQSSVIFLIPCATTVQWSTLSSVQLYIHRCNTSPFHSGKVQEAVAEPGVRIRKGTESGLGGREIKYYSDPPDV